MSRTTGVERMRERTMECWARFARECTRQNPVLEGGLYGLNHSCWPFTLALHFAQIADLQAVPPSGSGEDVGCRGSVLNGVVDSHTADRRHGVSRIAYQQQAGLVPARAAAGFDR